MSTSLYKCRIFVSACRPWVGVRYGASLSKGNTRNPKPRPFSPKFSKPTTDVPPNINWRKNAAELFALAARLGHNIEDIPSLKLIAEEQLPPTPVDKNPSGPRQAPINAPLSRLSVLGRSTMMHYVNEYLYFSHPIMNGSMLKDLASAITSEPALIELSSYIGATDLRRNNDSKMNDDSLAEIFCAVVGSIFQDLGPMAAKKMVHDFILPQLAGKDLEEVIKLEHPRTMLLSILADQKRPKPSARLISESGRATHFPSFVVGIYSGTDLLGEGTGSSLKRAEKDAMVTSLSSHFQKQLSTTPLPSDLEEADEDDEDDEDDDSAITEQSRIS